MRKIREVAKLNPMDGELSSKEKTIMAVLSVLNPVISGAIFYYGLRKVSPIKAKSANRISWAVVVIVGILYATYMYTTTTSGSRVDNLRSDRGEKEFLSQGLAQSILSDIRFDARDFYDDKGTYEGTCAMVNKNYPEVIEHTTCVDTEDQFAVAIASPIFGEWSSCVDHTSISRPFGIVDTANTRCISN